jgi:hypothetical protein
MTTPIDKIKTFLANPPAGVPIIRITAESATISAIAEGDNRRLSITTGGCYVGSHTVAHYRKAAGVPAEAKESRRDSKRPTGGAWYIVSLSWSVAPPPIQAGLFEGEQ